MDQQELILTNKKLILLPDEIPNTIQVDNISYINAAKNKINKITSFHHFSNLQMLNLSQNCLGNCLRSLTFMFEGLDNLKGLSLASNQIITLGEQVFSRCTQIRNLDLSHNKLSSTFRCLIYLHDLQILDLQCNQIDNVCHFKPLRQKLPSLLCIKLKGNSMENHYQNSFEQVIKSDYFPSVDFVVTKYSKIRDSDIIAKVQQRANVVHIVNDAISTKSFGTGEGRQKKCRSLSTNLPPLNEQSLVPRSPTPPKSQKHIDSPKFQEAVDIQEDNYFQQIESFRQREPSIIKEEDSQEVSIRSFLSPHLLIDSPEIFTLGRLRNSDRQRMNSCPNQQHLKVSSGKKGASGKRSDQNSDQKIDRLINQGLLQNEIDRVQSMLSYQQKELAKVEGSIVDEKRQSLQQQVLNQGFEELVRLTFGIDDEINTTFFTETLNRLKHFTQTIDIFATDKVMTLIFEIIRPLLNNEYHDLDQKMAGIQCLIERLKKCSLLI